MNKKCTQERRRVAVRRLAALTSLLLSAASVGCAGVSSSSQSALLNPPAVPAAIESSARLKRAASRQNRPRSSRTTERRRQAAFHVPRTVYHDRWVRPEARDCGFRGGAVGWAMRTLQLRGGDGGGSSVEEYDDLDEIDEGDDDVAAAFDFDVGEEESELDSEMSEEEKEEESIDESDETEAEVEEESEMDDEEMSAMETEEVEAEEAEEEEEEEEESDSLEEEESELEGEYDNDEEEEEASEEDETVEESADESEADAKGEASPSPPSASGPPVKVVVRTGLNCPLVDQSLDLTCSRQRDVASLKQRISRQMPGRPPVEVQRLLLGSRELGDDVLVDEIAPTEEEIEEDEEDEDGGDGMGQVQLTLDIPPPVDGKFATDFVSDVGKMTPMELLDAYTSNAAAMHYNAIKVANSLREEEDVIVLVEDASDGDDEAEVSGMDAREGGKTASASLTMRKHALFVKEELLSTLPDDVRSDMQDENGEDDEEGSMEDLGGDDGARRLYVGDAARKKARIESSRRRAIQGGAKMNIKRALQHNLNIDWPDTVRNALLLLFFGHFGARDAFSRMLMLVAAPMCFIIQARPVKIALKQLFYAIGEPPGIFLSLLPAPQQAIMGLDMRKAMTDLYGNSAMVVEDDVAGESDADIYGSYDEDDYDEYE